MKPKPTLCPGFDNNGRPFQCPSPPGTRWSAVWCPECDRRRRQRLGRQIRSLRDGKMHG